MKNKILLFLAFLLLIMVMNRFLSNVWLLITDSSNFMPPNSSLFTFKPTKIDSGSGGYWRYGEDNRNYYYFSEVEINTVFFIRKDNACKNFDKNNFKTWCSAEKITTKTDNT